MYLADQNGRKHLTPADSNENTRPSGATESGLSSAPYKRDEILGGRYRVISLLGRGGMGVVYRVEQIFLGKELALKTIDRHLMSDITVRRFQAEARAAFAVDHPNLVAVHDFGLFEDQTPFLVMEIVQGETLGERLKSGPLSLDEAIPIFVQVCFGLAHAHEHGVIHRDIKPNNIMLLNDVPEGIDTGAKILDFGIAKLAQREGGEIQALTRTGEIFGSPLYMSPEQCLGSKVDHRADIYSLGCVLFESLTGKPPFVGENAVATMMLHQSAPIPTLKDACPNKHYPPELERLLQLMLAKNPDHRLQHVSDAAFQLGALKSGTQAPLNNAILQTRRPAGEEERTGLVTIDKQKFYGGVLTLAIITFVISSSITYFSQSANFYSNGPAIDSSKQPEPAASGNKAIHNATDGAGVNGTGSSASTAHAGGTNTENSTTEAESGTGNNAHSIANTTSNQPYKTEGNAAANNNNNNNNSNHPGAPKTETEDSAVFSAGIEAGANSFHSKFATDESLEAFKGYKFAQIVNLQDGQFTGRALGNLKDSKVLLLALDNCILDTYDNLTSLPWLQVIDLSNSNIGDSAMPVLARLKMLNQLQLKGCRISENGLRELAKSTSLTHLGLTPGKYSATFIAELSEKMPACVIGPYKKESELHELERKLSEHSKDRTAILSKLLARAAKSNKYHSINSTYLIDLAQQHTKQQKFKEARSLIDKSLALCEQNGDHHAIIVPLRHEAAFTAVQDKDTKKAIALNDRAEQLYLDTCIHSTDAYLLTTLNEFCQLPLSLKQWDTAINYCKTAVGLIDQYPKLDRRTHLLPTFLERIGWLYYAQSKLDLAQPYLKRTLDITTQNKDSQPKPYLRALIEYAHTVSNDNERRKKMYNEGIEQLDKLGLLEDFDLNVHYCDACAYLSVILGQEGDHDGSAHYFQKV
ncbi:MAG: protein kinase [Candidatus Obscuribacterales bacterium]